MKTAIKDIIDWIDLIDNSVFALSAPANELRMLTSFRNKATQLLEKEKEEIKAAYTNGFYAGCDQPLFSEMPETYYNETYKKD